MAQQDWLVGDNRRRLAVRRIIDGAADLIARDGIDAVDIDAIAESVGCSRATVYRYVGGKSALADAVLADAGARIAEDVARQVKPLDGAERVVVAMTASLAAVRSDRVAGQMIDRITPKTVTRMLIGSPELTSIAKELTGMADDPLAAQWIVRVVLSFLFWPAADDAIERRIIERFVAESFRTEA